MLSEDLLNKIKEKYASTGENPNNYLKGLLHAKPINYWDYIQVDTLLSLQNTRTDFKDEKIFIMYHQVTELVLKMMNHELEQLVFDTLTEDVWVDKLNRLIRYTDMLITSFDVMRSGMNYDDYNTFRYTLTPASGFQSAQFRELEIYCTPLENLINEGGKERISENPDIDELFDQVYWKDAGHNRKTDTKSKTLQLFEEKYLEKFKSLARKVKGKTLYEQIQAKENPSEALREKLREFDHIYNVKWPIVHLETAQFYLDSKGESKAATGGSEWKKYLHPKYQQRKFFPNLWSAAEIEKWGEQKDLY